MEDDLVCEYDSTWDTESDGDDLGDSAGRRPIQDKNKKTRPGFRLYSSSRNLRAAKDMQNYRHGYPNINEEECPEERMTNLKFYLNEITSSPDEVSIEVFHKEWKTDYKRLERVHSYIQWLFPLREPGVNYMATELTKKEIQAFRESEVAKRRLVDSYELMLGFYGVQLLNRETGEVKRAENWRERFANLERNMHNNLRITRILKSLGELGFEHYQAPLVRFFLEETLVRKTLNSVKRSVLDYFVFAVRDKRERRKLIRYAFQHFEPKDKFVWCPRKIQKRFKKKSEKRQDSTGGTGEGGASDEGRSRGKTKEGEAGKDQNEERPGEDVINTKKQTTVNSTMSVDVNLQLVGSQVDPESPCEGSSVDPLPLNNGNTTDNGEMEYSGSAEFSRMKTQDGNGDEFKERPQSDAEVEESGNVGMPKVPVSDEEKPKEENEEEGMVKTSNGSSEHSSCQDQSRSTVHPRENHPSPKDHSVHGSPVVRKTEKTVTGSPKHVSPSSSLDERAEKLPRTNFSNSLPTTKEKEETVEMMNTGPTESQESDKVQNENQTNGSANEEPMEVEPGQCRPGRQ
ncbi:opioid growth factor receptor [Chanos chanos]|uniref:Opioid growth factor receptor n=1 Tax=Chanos chanos TaxID=29144 RepID=A0A6J2UVW1_CHACN|nr:opioid growth factor receptor-like protein 1 [Chanos chanos]